MLGIVRFTDRQSPTRTLQDRGVPKAAVGTYLRQGILSPTVIDKMVETTHRAIVGKFGVGGQRGP